MTPSAQVDATLTLQVQTPGLLGLCIAVTSTSVAESLTAQAADGTPVPIREVRDDLARTHVLDVPEGQTTVRYRAPARLDGHDQGLVDERQTWEYRRPSRYCPSDRLTGLASAQFGHADTRSADYAVEQWIHETVAYVPGVTGPVDDALHPLLARTGVCRDFAHLGVAVCRALGIPARYTAVYAPGLDPMDVHAVFEAAIDGRWYVFDGTRLAPRATLLRIGSGRDAADVALVTPAGAVLTSVAHDLTVTTDSPLPTDDRRSLIALP
jgi:transglutaminase-like putative cysteine protease